MPRCPQKDYADRCRVVQLTQEGLRRREAAAAVQRPERWVYRTLRRYDAHTGLASLTDRPSRPHRISNQTPSDVEQAICALKQAHPSWGRRQIGRQLRWQWRDDPAHRDILTDSRIRCVLYRHPELAAPVSAVAERSSRQIDYLMCNLLWGADMQQTRLPDNTVWETLHWLDLHSRFVLGQTTAAHLTEDLVALSFLQVATRYGLPYMIKTDRDKLFYEPEGGLPTLFERVTAAVGVIHLPIPAKQPWWNGVVERYIQTCQQEVQLPAAGDPDAMQHAMEAELRFYNTERCHSRCQDRPPATVYQPSSRHLPSDFALDNVPVAVQPIVTTRQVDASGRLSLAGHSYHFSKRYARQTVTVTVDGWDATAQAADGWQRRWDLRQRAAAQLAAPLPAVAPKPLLRTVNKHGSISVSSHLYYLGLAWAGVVVTLNPQENGWLACLPDGTTKSLPHPQVHALPRRLSFPPRPPTAPQQQPAAEAYQTRRVTRTGQVAFHNHLYYVGIIHQGQSVQVVPVSEGLAVYTLDHAWITTCPWPAAPKPDEPLCPT